MKTKLYISLLLSILFSTVAVSCNDDGNYTSSSDQEIINPEVFGVSVKTFRLAKNDSVLANLDSVFFSIDLQNARIFNADSLPVGTRVDRLVISMTLSSVSKAEIIMPNDLGQDTTINWLENNTDSINFSRGYVTLHLVSYNEEIQRDYRIYVNVHKMSPDQLEWGDEELMNLPGNISSPTAQKTVEYQDKVLCFTTDGTNFCRSSCDNLNDATFTDEAVTLPAGADIHTLSAGDTKLYVVAGGQLYESTDMGSTWTSTGAAMNWIYGCYGDRAVGQRDDATFVTYPATIESPMPAGAPVKATSTPIIYTSDWSEEAMMTVVGGQTADGKAVGAAWAYDGNDWVCLGANALPGIVSPVVVPYFAFKTSTSWVVTEQSVLLCFGGADVNNQPQETTYLSFDRGVHWTKAAESLQLPTRFTPGAYAQGIVYNKTMGSRAVRPITSWDCPFIYVFGGEMADGQLLQTVWKGVITRLTFKPLQ